MKAHYTVALALFAGFGLGAVAIHGLHAQATPPVYLITEIDVTDQENYMKDYGAPASAAIRAAGGRYVVQGGKTYPLDGEPPKGRVVVIAWDSIEKIQAWRGSTAWKELQPIREKVARFRSFAVEGLLQ
jgi:uncharacterized protein (DUF1330 family)